MAPGDRVVVKSETYGEHTRAPRGSKTRAVLNNAMEETSRRLVGSNIPAQLIHNALKPYRENFTGGLIWQSFWDTLLLRRRKSSHTVLSELNIGM
jgi:hypothetical protein